MNKKFIVEIPKIIIHNKIKDLLDRKVMMLEYLKLKVREEDWHGVADAAMDLRDIESELMAWREINGQR
jgi:hypothetical protein